MNIKRVVMIPLVLILAAACGGDSEFAAEADPPAPIKPEATSVPTTAPSTPADAVAILLVDDFQTAGGGDVQDFLEANRQPQEGNCTVTPDGQGHYFTAGMGHYITLGMGEYTFFDGVPHGALVYTKAMDELASLGVGDAEFIPTSDFYTRLLTRVEAGEIGPGGWTDSGLDWFQGLQRWDVDGKELLMAAVDTGGFNTAVVADRIKAAMEALAVSEWEVTSFVINMSFAIIPCDSALDLSDYQSIIDDDTDLQHLQQLLQGKIGNDEAALIFTSRMIDLREAYEQGAEAAYDMSIQSQEDSLYQLLDNPPFQIAPVASSGNFRHLGYAFPFAPAMWSEVASVGADAEYANPAEVIMEDIVVFNELEAVGTSFSAPAFSVWTALYLLDDGTISCSGDTGSSQPPISYASENGPWQNLSIGEAASEYCKGFLN